MRADYASRSQSSLAFLFSLLWSANGTIVSRGYRLNKRIIPRRSESLGCVWKFIRKMRTLISSSVKGKMYNGSAPFVVHPDACEIFPANFWCLYRKFVRHEKIARNVSNQFYRHRIFYIHQFSNLKNEKRIYIQERKKIITKLKKKNYIIGI